MKVIVYTKKDIDINQMKNKVEDATGTPCVVKVTKL